MGADLIVEDPDNLELVIDKYCSDRLLYGTMLFFDIEHVIDKYCSDRLEGFTVELPDRLKRELEKGDKLSFEFLGARGR